ncbi:MAG: glycosyltransferase [Parachlamydia sp.]|jgi:glycosyltransferase involved in cell wall biosynthesis|nr:glycosyltransferase [Parachlamydia sp.]
MFSLVSVVIPAFNQEKFLSEALTSVINQSYSDLEIILVDDGSTDSTLSIAYQYAEKDERITVLTQSNRGPAAARNRGIQAARGGLIALLDGDDRMALHRIAKQVDTLLQERGIAIVYTALGLMDEEGKESGVLRSHDYSPENFLPHQFFRNVIPGPSTILARRECLLAHPYNEALLHAEDYDLMLRLAHHYQFKYLDEALTFYRRHSKNLSNSLSDHLEAEKKIMPLYSVEHIAAVIEKSTLSPLQKTLLKGKILFKKEEWQAAIALLTIIDNLRESSFYLGNCFAKLRRWEEAFNAYHKELNICMNHPACHNNLGILYAMKNDYKEAAYHFHAALQEKKGYMDAEFNLRHLNQVDALKWTWRELRPDLLPYRTDE